MEYVIGVSIGGLLGLTGAGGSVFAVPLLILLMGLPASEAMGTALGAVACAAFYGVIHQRHRVLWSPGAILAVSGMIVAPLGKWVSLHVPELWLLVGFSMLAFIIAIRMWRQSFKDPVATRVTRGASVDVPTEPQAMLCRYSPDGIFHLQINCVTSLVIGGVIIGFVSGVFGVGGGFLIVPFLLFVSGMPMKTAVATSLFSIVLVSSAGFVSHVLLTEGVEIFLLSKIILSALLGMILSQQVSAYLAGPLLQQIFSVALIIVSVFTVAQNFLG